MVTIESFAFCVLIALKLPILLCEGSTCILGCFGVAAHLHFKRLCQKFTVGRSPGCTVANIAALQESIHAIVVSAALCFQRISTIQGNGLFRGQAGFC